jgi:peroxiredoxin
MLKVGDLAPAFEFESLEGKKVNFPADFKGKWVALHFLRHLGCPLCQEKLNELRANQQKYKDAGIELFVVVQSTEKRVKDFSLKKGMHFLIGDHPRKLYQLYGAEKGNLAAFLAPSVMLASVRATLKGNLHGAFEGDELQKPALFIIAPDNRIAFIQYGKNIADIISEKDFFEIFAGLRQEKGK